jgi:hypothetical protein
MRPSNRTNDPPPELLGDQYSAASVRTYIGSMLCSHIQHTRVPSQMNIRSENSFVTECVPVMTGSPELIRLNMKI